MFFNLSKILIFLTDPLFFLLLILLILGLKTNIRKTALVLFSGFYLLSTPFLSQRLLYLLEHLEVESKKQTTYDAVVVLSGMVHLDISDGHKIEFGSAVDRILAGVKVVKTGQADFLLLSGGSGSLKQTDGSEAVLLSKFASWLGVEDQRILLDPLSRNTFENAVNVSQIAKEKGFSKLLLVTSAFHMKRARGCLHKQGIVVDVLPVDYRSSLEIKDFTDFLPSSDALADTNLFLHEVVGILVYAITGKADI